MTRFVRIYDFDTKLLTSIPESELAPGYVKAIHPGIDGEFFVDASKVLNRCKSQAFKHPPLGPAVREIFAHFAEVFVDVMPQTVQEWEDQFRRDEHPDKELEIWWNMAKAYMHFSHGNKGPLEARKDYFNIILSCFNNGCDVALQVIQLRRLSMARAKQVVEDIRKRTVRK